MPEPLWDQWKGVMVLPAGLTEAEADDAVAQLVRERTGGAPGCAADVRW